MATDISPWLEWVALARFHHRAIFLRVLSRERKIQVKSIAEIGVYEGDSSRLFRFLFPDATLYLIDPWKLYSEYLSRDAGPMSENDQDYENAYQTVKSSFKDDPKCKILRKTSSEAAASGDLNDLDLVFIDGNHSYKYVKEDIHLWLPKVRSGGILSGHDYHPEQFPGVVRAVTEAFAGNFEVGTDSTWFHLKN